MKLVFRIVETEDTDPKVTAVQCLLIHPWKSPKNDTMLGRMVFS